ncbi:MAG: DUF7336 domain-containing protein [Candidatus Thorarchaeota archaeon]|jgi:hypothetical protein
MSDVYVLQRHAEDEPEMDSIVGVYSAPEKAEEAKEKDKQYYPKGFWWEIHKFKLDA